MVDILKYMKGDGRIYRVDNNRGSSELMRTAPGRGEREWFHQKNSEIEQLGHDDHYIYRGLDTSDFSGKVYMQFYKGKLGAPWIKRHMKVGEIFWREPEVRWFKARHDWTQPNPSVEIGDFIPAESSVVPSEIKLLALHETFNPHGVLLRDVIELGWFVGGAWSEHYYYAAGFGLVGFRSESANFESWLADLNPGAAISNIKRIFRWDNPPFPPVGTTTPPVDAGKADTDEVGMFRPQGTDETAQPAGVNLLANPALTGFPTPPIQFDNNGSVGFIEYPDGWEWVQREREGFPPPESYHRDEGYEISVGSREWVAGYSQQVDVRAGRRYRLSASFTPALYRFDDNPLEPSFIQWRFEVRGEGLRLNSPWATVAADGLKQRHAHEFTFEAREDGAVTVAFVGRGTAWDYIYKFNVHRIEMVPLEQTIVERATDVVRETLDADEPKRDEPVITEPDVTWVKALATEVGGGATNVRAQATRSSDVIGMIDVDVPVEYAPGSAVPDGGDASLSWIPVRSARWSGQGWVRSDVVRFAPVGDAEKVVVNHEEQLAPDAEKVVVNHEEQVVADAEKVVVNHEEQIVGSGIGVLTILRVQNHTPGIDVNDIALRDALFQRLPVELSQTEWFQYFGNTHFAHKQGKEGSTAYHYCQGLHGGLDFGNPARGVQVRAAVEGVIRQVNVNSRFYRPNYTEITAGDFTIIYGHMANPTPFAPGARVSPDTVVGEIDGGGQGHENHVHVEVRYKGTWIVNPLLMMPAALRDAILARFVPFTEHFYHDGMWSRWLDPCDQPVLRLTSKGLADVIGPHAARG